MEPLQVNLLFFLVHYTANAIVHRQTAQIRTSFFVWVQRIKKNIESLNMTN